MALLLKLGAVDLSTYVRVTPGEGMDPYDSSGFLEPAFTTAPLGNGDPLVNVNTRNRQMAWPLFLSDTTKTKDALHALIRTINSEIAVPTTKPLRLEWKDDSASSSTFYDVAYARFDPDFNYRRSGHGYAAGVLRVWCAPPFGHTATDRAMSSAVASMIPLAVATIPAGSVVGDAPALLTLGVGVGSFRPAEGRLLAVSALPASYTAWIPAASFVGAAVPTADARAPASQSLIKGVGISMSNFAQFDIPAPSAHMGANRMIGVVRALTHPQTFLRAFGPDGGACGPTVVASAGTMPGYQAVDLGVLNVPTQWVAPSQYRVDIRAAMPSQTAAFSNHQGSFLHEMSLAGVVLLPEEQSALFMDQPAKTFALDSFRYSATPVASGAGDELGNRWNDALADNSEWINTATTGMAAGGANIFGSRNGPGGAFNNASAVNARISALVGFSNLAGGASGRVWFELRKETASQFGGGIALTGVRAHYDAATPCALSLVAMNAGVTQIIASVAIPTANMFDTGGVIHGYLHAMRLHVNGNEVWADLSLADDRTTRVPQLASIGVASWGGGVGSAGQVGFAMRQATSISAVVTLVHFRADSPAPTTMLERDLYTFDVPDAVMWRKQGASGAAGDLVARLEGAQRGRLPGVDRSTERLAFVSLPRVSGIANDMLDAAVKVREQFYYAR